MYIYIHVISLIIHSIFSAKIIPISRIFDKYKRLRPFASVLYRTYNLLPLARICISDTTLALVL